MGDSEKVSRSSIPEIEAIKPAVLKALSSGRQRTFGSLDDEAAKCLGLSSKQKSYRIAGSETSLFSNRVEKARAELRREGLIEYPVHGKAKLTAAGKAALAATDGAQSQAAAEVDEAKSPTKTDQSSSTAKVDAAKKTVEETTAHVADPDNLPNESAPYQLGSFEGGATLFPSEPEKQSSGSPSKLPIILAAVGLALCLTGVFAFVGVLCGIAALVLRYRSKPGSTSASAASAPKATFALGVCSVALGALIMVGGAAAGGNNANVQEPPDDSTNAQAFSESEQHELSFMVVAEGEGEFPASVAVRITGAQSDGKVVNDRLEASIGKAYALSYPAGTYSFAVEQSSLANGGLLYKADEESCTFDGAADKAVRIAFSHDAEATQKAEAAKEEAERKKAEEAAAKAAAEQEEAAAAAAAAAVEQEAAAAAAEQEAAAAAAANAYNGGDDTVYVTNTGGKYHAGGCKYLKKSKIPISRSDALAQGYGACSVCNP